MKKFLIIILVILAVAGLYVFKNNKQNEQVIFYKDNIAEDRQLTTENKIMKNSGLGSQGDVHSEYAVETNDSINVAGSYSYFMNKEYTPSGFGEYVFGKVCFEPSQMETVNGGDSFCFKNTNEALAKFGINKIEIDLSCKKYWSSVVVEISDLTSGNKPYLKSNECFTTDTCRYEDAELVSVVEFIKDKVPKCRK